MGKHSSKDKPEKSSKKHKSSHKGSKSSRVIDDDLVGDQEGEFEWAEKAAPSASGLGDRASVQSIPTSLSMNVRPVLRMRISR